jgi:tRNA (adenine37-N6)-methyltransferase
MDRKDDLRPGERAVEWTGAEDAGLVFIGRIRTPWMSRVDCPRQGNSDGPICRIEVFQPWAQALAGIEAYDQVEVLYWLHKARRDILLQSPRSDGNARGAFSLRSPVRPNPIGTSLVSLIGVEGATLLVRGLDCLDGTPLIDLKPDRCQYSPIAPAKNAPAA